MWILKLLKETEKRFPSRMKDGTSLHEIYYQRKNKLMLLITTTTKIGNSDVYSFELKPKHFKMKPKTLIRKFIKQIKKENK
jgi:hypothetical protein